MLSDQTDHEPSIADLTSDYKAMVDSALERLADSNTVLSMAAREALLSKGKRLRPILALLTCEAVCGDRKRAMPVALAYEMAHAASLTQDDIIDESSLRHEKPAVHTKLGVANAILVSDILLFEIFEILADYEKLPITKTRLTRVLRYLGEAARRTAEGEYLEVELSRKKEPTEQEYLDVAAMKTGALFAAAAASGALVGGARNALVRGTYEFGKNLGISFQILDDILDITGDPSKLGKPVFKDLQNNASNIVIFHALTNSDPYSRNFISSMIYRKSFGISDVEELNKVLGALGSVEYAMNLARGMSGAARAGLAALQKSEAREKLEKLTRILTTRRR